LEDASPTLRAVPGLEDAVLPQLQAKPCRN
jgi:hypothetical protein